VPLNVTSTIQS